MAERFEELHLYTEADFKGRQEAYRADEWQGQLRDALILICGYAGDEETSEKDYYYMINESLRQIGNAAIESSSEVIQNKVTAIIWDIKSNVDPSNP